MDFSLIETFRFDPAEGFLRLERHLRRLENSAAQLGFDFGRSAIERELEKSAHANSPLRVRLELSRDGSLAVTATPFAVQEGDTVWQIAIAATRLNSRDPLLAHKTTRRAVYEEARAEFALRLFQEVLLENEQGEICEGTITNVFIRKRAEAPLLTPPAAAGLLPGVLRSELLEKGAAREHSIRRGDLELAQEIFVGNSLRGLIRARLASA